jgi:hypothetical protein
LFRSYEVNQRTDARGLKGRHGGKSKGKARTETRVRTNVGMQARMRTRAKMMMEVEWVPSIYLAVINK